METMPYFHPDSTMTRTSPTACWTSPAWDPTPALPTWGLLTPSTPTASWNITPTFQYQTLFGNTVTTQAQVPTGFKWESEERRQAADDMFHFLKVIEWAQDFEEKIHHMFKSGRRALLYHCEEPAVLLLGEPRHKSMEKETQHGLQSMQELWHWKCHEVWWGEVFYRPQREDHPYSAQEHSRGTAESLAVHSFPHSH
jgi:hypothetical protein